MTEQLSMRLEPELPNLPLDLRPMLARSAPEPFDSADHLFEPSWGGERALAFVEAADRGPLRLLGVQGRDLAALVPELADLQNRTLARSAVIDGELVVVDSSGRADPLGLAERLAGRPGPPVAYLVFDLLVLDGRPLLREPLERRRRLLRGALTPGDAVIAVPAIVGSGLALHAAVRAQGITGMMARVRGSPYLPGLRSRLWRWIEAGPASAQTAVGDPAGAPAGTRSPVLTLISRLPFDDV
ncbi:MAG: ATP-dependent DNA ligase [Candidatus Limnocylindrales bacterium]